MKFAEWVPVDNDFDEVDIGFDSQDKDIKPSRRAFEVDYRVYGPQDIQNQQDKQIDEVSAILGQPSEATAILLRYLRWNKERLIESYMDHQEEVLVGAGLGSYLASPPRIVHSNNFSCEICCDDEPQIETFAMKCGHRFCVDCYRHYLVQKIKGEGEAARIKCPGESCNRIVDSKSLEMLIPEDIKFR